MLERLKKIEKDLMGVYTEIQKEIPNLRNLSFEINTWDNGDTAQYGYYHIGNDCGQHGNITELAALATEAKERRTKNEILYQQFGGGV